MAIEYYPAPYDYIKTAKTLKEKIKKIDDIIEALEDVLLKGALTADLEELQLNDGQTIIKTIYRNLDQINTAIDGLEARRNKLQYKLTGRIKRLRNNDNII